MKKIIILAIFCISIATCFGQDKKPDLMTVVKDLIQTKKTGQTMKQVWWLPSIYWELALKDSPLGSEGMIDEINSIFNDYSLFIILDADITAFSGMKKNEISDLKLEINGNSYEPIESYSDEIKGMIDVLRPMYKQMLGEMGESIEFFVFDNTDKKDAISPLGDSNFSINFNDSNFEYNLPLASMVDERICPVDDKKHNGSWKYCPYHGKKLKEDN